METALNPCETTLPTEAPRAARKGGRASARHTRKSPWSMEMRVHIASAVATHLQRHPVEIDELQRRLGNDSPWQVREDLRSIRSAARLGYVDPGFDRLLCWVDACGLNPLQILADALKAENAKAMGRLQ